jgi:heme exporter protein A
MGAETFDRATFSGSGLACRRGGRTVFARLGFALAGGEALVLRGANGSGKSTLLRLMAGLGVATAGTLAWNGGAVDDDPEAHGARTRFVGHLDALKPSLTVRENLVFAARLWGDPAGIRADAALEIFGLGALTDLPVRVLSAGQRHRLSLARLLVVPAPLWLLDEPGNALDDEGQKALAAAIVAHRAANGIVIVAAHGNAPVTGGTVLDVSAYAAAPPPHWSDAA